MYGSDTGLPKGGLGWTREGVLLSGIVANPFCRSARVSSPSRPSLGLFCRGSRRRSLSKGTWEQAGTYGAIHCPATGVFFGAGGSSSSSNNTGFDMGQGTWMVVEFLVYGSQNVREQEGFPGPWTGTCGLPLRTIMYVNTYIDICGRVVNMQRVPIRRQGRTAGPTRSSLTRYYVVYLTYIHGMFPEHITNYTLHLSSARTPPVKLDRTTAY
uniref:Uncharacterized protein n=1 Tax=Coccidioides posadasii RMSCC 3488 TaxID=454284 RepID=A0A0J6FJJ2_COCPO|nr:hypothetical protein CPAG_05885 [Coccidioides posadasii RMSCC 3488]